MIEKELLSIVENLKEFQNILLGHKIKVFTHHTNITYKTIESAYQYVQRWKRPIQDFGVTLLYIKGEANVAADDFIRIPMAHHAHKSEATTLEEDTCELLCLYLLFISDNTDCLSLDTEDISFPLAPQIVEAEQKLKLQCDSSNNIMTNLNKDNSDWKYKPVEGINLVHYRDSICVLKTLCKRVLKQYH